MAKSKKKSRQEPLIPLKTLAHALRVSERQINYWVLEKKFRIKLDDFGRECVVQSEFKKLAHSEEAKKQSIEAFWYECQRRGDDIKDKNQYFEIESAKKLKEYREYIAILEGIHSKYHDRLDILNEESPVVAAYILFSKVISLLKMTCICFENGYVEAFTLIRPIDEAINLAEYFIITANSVKGKQHLKEWFRENRSPSNAICRETISKYMQSFSPKESPKKIEKELTELYHGKSKAIHHTFNGIIEFYHAKTNGSEFVPVGFDYGVCSYPRKLFEHIVFFQSSIWTSFQGFFKCFYASLPLDQDDLDLILKIDKTFLKEMEDRRRYGIH